MNYRLYDERNSSVILSERSESKDLFSITLQFVERKRILRLRRISGYAQNDNLVVALVR